MFYSMEEVEEVFSGTLANMRRRGAIIVVKITGHFWGFKISIYENGRQMTSLATAHADVATHIAEWWQN